MRRFVIITCALGACDGAVDAGPSGSSGPDGPTPIGIALQEGPTVAFDVGVDAVYCAAAVRCEPALLDDPFSGERGPTLVLAYTCRGSDGGTPLDVFQTIARRMVCHDVGDPADPATWDAGREIVPLREEVWSGLATLWGDTQYNLAILPIEARAAAFCRVEGWGVYDGTAMSDARAVRHVAASPVVHWDVVVEATDDGLDCHLDDGLVALHRGPAISVTQSLPEPAAPGSYPRRQTVVAVVPTVTPTTVGFDTLDIHSLQVVVAPDVVYPAPPHAQAPMFSTRELWFWEPASGLPLDVRGGASCAEIDADGTLGAIAVELIELFSDRRLGAVVLAASDAHFDCARDAFGACLIVPPGAYPTAAPCLVR